MMRIAITELRRNPIIAECEPVSFLGTVIQASQLGLELGGALGHAYPVPFWNSKKRYRECQLIVGYRGFMELARRSGLVKKIDARAVYSGDVFDVAYGFDEKLVHVPALMNDDAGDLIATYAIATIDSETKQFEVVSRRQIDVVKTASLDKMKEDWQKKSSPWELHFDEMARKTAVRRLFKYLPVSVERHDILLKAIQHDNDVEDGLLTGSEVIKIDPVPPPTEGQAELAQKKGDEIEELREAVREALKEHNTDGKRLAALLSKTGIKAMGDIDRCKEISTLNDALEILTA